MTRMTTAKARMEALADETARLARHERRTQAQERRLVECADLFDQAEAEFYRAQQDESLAAVSVALRGGGTGPGALRVEGGTDTAPTVAPRHRSAVRGRALDTLDAVERTSDVPRAVLDMAAGWVEQDTTRDSAMSEWVNVAGSHAYRSAFGKVLRNPTLGQYEWTDEERGAFAAAQQYQRAVAISPDSAGGYLVPLTLDPSIILTGPSTSNRSLRDAFTVRTIATDQWVGVSSAGVTAEWAAEAQEVAETSPTFGSPVIPVHRGDAFVPFSFEAQGDIRGLEAELTPLMRDAKERLEARAFILGTGVGQPRGFITAAAANPGSLVATTTADTFALADLYKVKRALPTRYRTRAEWLGSEDMWDAVRQMTPADDSRVWVEGNTPRLLGRGVVETSEMDAQIDVGQTNYLTAYGDLSAYVVVDRVGASVELVPHLMGANRRPTGQRGLLMWWRTGGDLVNPDAVRVLNA